MNNLPGNTEIHEKSANLIGKDIKHEQKGHRERSLFDTAEIGLLTRHPPGSNSLDANLIKAPSQSIAEERVHPITKDPGEVDRTRQTDEAGIIRLAYVDKMNRQPKSPPKRPLETLRMSKAAFQEIRHTIGSYPVETGGLLMGSSVNFQVIAFIFDNVSHEMRRRKAVWYPHTESLNERVEIAERKGLVFLGVVHSHPRGCIRPSDPDEAAAWSNMTSASNPHLNAYLLPIVQSSADGPFQLRFYVATCHPKGLGRVIVREIKLKLID